MRSKLNPDGARIRDLRIRRGWTQEQLAEIAGVSPRTIQRVETASCASFESLRAVAGAFETDFDQLLKPQGCGNSGPEPHIVSLSYPADLESEIEPIPANPPKPPLRRIGTMTFLSAFTLIVGLAAGIFVTLHFDVGSKSHSPAPPNHPAIPPRAEISQAPLRPATTVREPAREVPFTKEAIPAHTFLIAESRENSGPAEPPAEGSITADSDLENINQGPPASVSPDLVLQPHSQLSALIIPEAPAATSKLPVLSGSRALEEPDIGAVRLAVDLASKRTGAFVSKVGTSIKRVF